MSSQSVKDLFYSVIRVEKAGAEFYRKLAGEVRNQAVKDVFLRLFKDEVQHQKDFLNIAENMVSEGVTISSSVNLTEVMSSMADEIESTIRGAELVSMGEADIKQAIDIGIHTERESIRAYSELLEIKYAAFSLVLNRIIEEEKKHQNWLEKLKAELLGG
jgi:rubrerythrin